jgi:1,6-anhydro-N-acetylmuramate kinase
LGYLMAGKRTAKYERAPDGRIIRPVWYRTPKQWKEAEALAVRFVAQLAVGDHAYEFLAAEFAAWCEASGIACPGQRMLPRWLQEAGLHRWRAGKARVTIYTKSSPQIVVWTASRRAVNQVTRFAA